jgi:hypothetical protein
MAGMYTIIFQQNYDYLGDVCLNPGNFQKTIYIKKLPQNTLSLCRNKHKDGGHFAT